MAVEPLPRESPMSLTDRRRHPRFPFHSRARLLLGSAENHGTLVDISFAGALFSPDTRLQARQRDDCWLTIYRRGRPSLPLIEGHVVHVAEHMLGIQFLPIDATVESELRLMIEMNLAVPHLLDRDVPALFR